MEKRLNIYKILILLVCCSSCFPLFSLIIKGWVSATLFFSTLVAVILLVIPYFKPPPEGIADKDSLFCRNQLGILIILFIFAFALPLISVAFSQLLQGKWDIARFDAPSRYLFAITIFLVIAQYKNFAHLMLAYTIPASAIITFALIHFVPKTFWSTYPGRLSNHFIDPLIFGQVTLALGVMSLLMIGLVRDRSVRLFILQLIGGVAGIYLSLRSGSRTGWLAIPFIVFIYAIYVSPFKRWKTILFSGICTAFMILVIYSTSTTLKTRFNDFYTEVKEYRWHQMNADTNVGVRISWIRIGWYFFSMRPISGWGDKTLENNINDATIAVYASQESREGILIAGFHNDFVSNAVRYGLGGLVATVGIFFIPLLFFAYYLRNKRVQSYALVGIGYVLIQSVSSLSYHVLDFKFMASFYAMMISLLIGIMVNKLKS